MPPNSVFAVGGDSVTLSAYAVGVPPLAYQWRQNGVAISGATTNSLSLSKLSPSSGGNYDVVVTNLYGAATSAASTVTVDTITVSPGQNYVIDSNPNFIEHDGVDLGATWLNQSTDGAGVTRAGVMSFSAAATNGIVVPSDTNFNASAGTVMFWTRSSGVVDPNGNPVVLFDRSGADGLQILQNPDGTILAQIVSATGYAVQSSAESDNKWHFIAVTFDQVATTLNLYVGLNPSPVLKPGCRLGVGRRRSPSRWGISLNSTNQPYNGLLADVRFYNQALTAAKCPRFTAADPWRSRPLWSCV